MEADQIGFALRGVVQPKTCKLAVAGVNVVQIDILHRRGEYHIAANLSSRKQEQGRVAHKVLDISQTELGLNGNVSGTQIVVCVQNVCKTNNGGYILLDSGELVQHLALRLCQSSLPSSGRSGQGAGLEEGVELIQNDVLKLGQESVIGLFNGNLRAVLVHVLNGNGLRILLDGQVSLCRLSNGCLAVRDNLARINSAALQRNICGVGHQRSARGLADRANNAQNISQRVPVVTETGNKIHLTGSNAGIDVGETVAGISHSFNFSSCHYKAPFNSAIQDFRQALSDVQP